MTQVPIQQTIASSQTVLPSDSIAVEDSAAIIPQGSEPVVEKPIAPSDDVKPSDEKVAELKRLLAVALKFDVDDKKESAQVDASKADEKIDRESSDKVDEVKPSEGSKDTIE